jgi:hypothetical protein
MKTLPYILALNFYLTFSSVFGQLIPYGLQLDKVQKEIIQKTSEFDSTVLVDKASYWNEDKKMNGFGFKDNHIYRLTIFFIQDTTSSYDISIKKIMKSKVTKKSKIDAIKKTDYSTIVTFSNDSLNLKSQTNSYLSISDELEWTILIVKKNNFILKQSYAPETYQKIAPTKERQIFMDTLTKIEGLL